jgi:uncharacterized membrane protein YidH (DUF202 family)
MNQITESDVKLASVIRNGLLAGAALVLLSMTTCSVANWHYEYLDKQMQQTRYLVTRPW